ncbi:TPA: TcfC E-set like domain-containing protein [Salmonella enterica subsp. enterica serovar Muenchen]|nr:TcfC E-set like domain-containing protein [Salmonella enterica subsp. enterica serovar Muenchen]HEC8861534.1 TcfC E-set like domain-containing protein [Salmonella enterica subsp. enterica serovar Muenchen]
MLGKVMNKMSIALLASVISTILSPTYARSIPAGFEALSLGHDEFLSVILNGESIGVFKTFVTPESLTFKEPNILFSKLPLDNISDNVRDKVRYNLSTPKSRHEGVFNLSSKEDISVIYNERDQAVVLIVNPNWIKSKKNKFMHPSYNSQRALVGNQSLAFSYSTQMKSLGGDGYLAQGVSDKGYLKGDWSFFKNIGPQITSSSFQIRNLYLREDIAPQFYIQGGRMDTVSLNSRLGGDFSLPLLPISQIEGIRMGSTRAYINTEFDGINMTPLTVMLSQSARVDVFKGKQLLGSHYLDSGLHEINTKDFPAGVYPVTLKVYQNGRFVRQETQFVENSNVSLLGSGQLQWFAQAGNESQNTYNNLEKEHSGKKNIVGGGQFGLSKNLTLTTAIMKRERDNVQNENDLSFSLPTSMGVWFFKAGYLNQGKRKMSDTEQVNWNMDSSSFSFSRYHVLCDRNGGCHNSNYNVNASTQFGGWTASLGYSLSHSTWQSWQGNAEPFYGERDFRRSFRHQYYYNNSSILLTLSTSLNYSLWNIWPRMGFFINNRGSNQNRDNGIFMNISLSKNVQTASGISHNITAMWDYHQHSNDNRMSLRQQWAWKEHDYRAVEANLSGGKNSQNMLLNGEWDNSVGNSIMSFEYGRMNNFSYKTMNGHYDSSFAISSSGVALGGGNSSALSGIIVDAHNEIEGNDSEASAEINSSQGVNYLKKGKLFVPAMEYMSDFIDIEDVSTYNCKRFIRGIGKYDFFLLPGHILLNKLEAVSDYIYVGRLQVKGGGSLAGGHILNADVPDINTDSSFIAEFSSAPDSLYVLRDGQFYNCPVKYKKTFNGIRQSGVITCQNIDMATLPSDISSSDRVQHLTAMN